MVEMISCLKDWKPGAARQQHEVKNEELLVVVVFSETVAVQ
jgi:hypothetical protein